MQSITIIGGALFLFALWMWDVDPRWLGAFTAAWVAYAFNSMVHLLGAIVTDHGGFASHAAIVARECGFPAVVGSVDATERLHTGQRVVVDGDLGEVRIVR